MRKQLLLATALLYLVLPATSFAKDRFLQGRVLLVGEQDELKPVVGQDVTLVESGDAARTKEGGRFRIFLKDIFRPGTKITLSVEKKGWRTQYPLEGEMRVPEDLEKEIVEVRLLPIGSKKFWSADRIEKLIRDTADKAKQQVRPEIPQQQQAPIDLSRYIKDWAAQYGFTPQQAKEEIGKWVGEVEQKQEDFYKLGLAEYYKMNFRKTYDLASESGQRHARAYEHNAQQAEINRVLAVRDYKLAGDAAYSDYRFNDALVAYTQAERYVPKMMTIEWAELQDALGKSNWALGIRMAGAESAKYLQDALSAVRATLTVLTKDLLPQNWARSQNSLGVVLSEQGARIGGEAGTRLLAQAVQAYKAALTVQTKESHPQDWAAAQNNLGTALGEQGTHTSGEAGTRLLAQAVQAYKAALTIYTKEALPQQWAITQNNLGIMLREQGTRTSGEAGTSLLDQALEGYCAVLTVYTKAQFPQQWAGTQNNLGNVLWAQGTRTSGEAGTRLLGQAVQAYKAALTVRTKESLPQDWAMTQNNLGLVLSEHGTRTGGKVGTQLLTEAVAAYHAALEIRTREHLPEGWAQTHSNLAKTAFLLEDWLTAAESYRNVLTLYPDYKEAYQAANVGYHEKLFDYPLAFDLTKQWVERHPEDFSAQANFAEAHLTTGRYGEAEWRLAELLKKPDLQPSSAVGLRIVDIVTALALKKANTVPQKLQDLQTLISGQPESFHAEWSFDGTKHFVQVEQVFAPYRPWLMELFDVVKSKDRTALLDSLGRVQASFNP